MLTETIKGKSTAEADQVFEAFRDILTDDAAEHDPELLGDLEVMSGVSAFPTRIKCATLAWHALHSALEGSEETVKTE
jgi:nitrogen fixation NifU-like protein